MGDCACVLNSHKFFLVNIKLNVFMKLAQLFSRKYFWPYGTSDNTVQCMQYHSGSDNVTAQKLRLNNI